MRKVLVVEDEDVIRDFVVINLKRSGYDVVDAASGEEGLNYFEEDIHQFDVILLDLMLPGIDGYTVCKEIRKKNVTVGIIMLSAKSQEIDKVNGLMMGADDYITKPFSTSELVARIDAICRRLSIGQPEDKKEEDILRSGPFEMDFSRRTFTKNGEEIDLTQVEFQIMELFIKNADIALERQKILTEIWGENYFGDVKIVDVNIRRLRMKIEDEPSDPKYITTVWGFGYKWKV